MLDLLSRLAVSTLPVLLFLWVLVYLDSYKLVRLHHVLAAIAAGGAVALLCYPVHRALMGGLGLELSSYTRYLGPVLEETGKALLVVYLVRSHRVGFLVDAAVYGFAVGTGFAVVENTVFLGLIPDAGLAVWLVRGFGTAFMHGGATAMLAVVSRLLAEERPGGGALVFLPGFGLAVLVHSFFNHFFLNPVLSTVVILLLLPPVLLLVFARSERSLRGWLQVGFDADTELLGLIHSGAFSESRVGRYLHSLQEHFRGEVVADMLCYLRLHLELSLQAKGLLMMRNAGFRVSPDEETTAKLEELRYLEGSIGRTGKRAMQPFLRGSGKDLWQLSLLGGK